MKSYFQSEQEFSKIPRVQMGTIIIISGFLGFLALLQHTESTLLRIVFLLIELAGVAIIIRERLKIDPRGWVFFLMSLVVVVLMVVYFLWFAR
jgi:hypothetical protein